MINSLFKICFIGLLLGTSQLLTAQTPEDLLMEPSNLLNEELRSQRGNQSELIQQGRRNTAEVNQVLTDQSSVNVAKLVQSGRFNLAIVRQEGYENRLALVQRGTNNYYEIQIEGHNNNIAISQQGKDNRIIQKINQVNGLDIELIQIGNDNEIVQILEGDIDNKNIKVIQQGDGMKMRIEQSKL